MESELYKINKGPINKASLDALKKVIPPPEYISLDKLILSATGGNRWSSLGKS
jgi:hypothetical protein